MFESILDVLVEKIKKREAVELQLSEKFSENRSKDSKCFIKNWLYELPNCRKWRITKLDGGDKLQVFNTVAYPSFKSEMPILGVDILWFGQSQKLLAVFDYQPLIQEIGYLNKYCSSLQIIKNQYSEFDNTKMKNIYDENKYFSPWVIICRGDKSNLEIDLNKIFSLFLVGYLNIIDNNPKNQFLNFEQIKKLQTDYDIYSSDKDPAGKLFKSFFGDSWTNDFIKNYLFTLS